MSLENQMSIFAIFPGFLLALAVVWVAARREDAPAAAGLSIAYLVGWFVVVLSSLIMAEILLSDGAIGLTPWTADDWQGPQILAPLEEPIKLLGGILLIAVAKRWNSRGKGALSKFMPVEPHHYGLIGFGVGLGFAGLETLYGYALPFAQDHGSTAGECIARLRVGSAVDHASYAGIAMLGWYLTKLTGRGRWLALALGTSMLLHSMHNALTEINFLLLIYPLLSLFVFLAFLSLARSIAQLSRVSPPQAGGTSQPQGNLNSPQRRRGLDEYNDPNRQR